MQSLVSVCLMPDVWYWPHRIVRLLLEVFGAGALRSAHAVPPSHPGLVGKPGILAATPIVG